MLTLAACGNQESAQVLAEKARIAIAAGEFPTAEIHLRNLIQSHDSAHAREMLAAVHRARGDRQSERKDLERAIAAGGQTDVLVPLLLEAALASGDYRGAMDIAKGHALAKPAARARLLLGAGRAHAALNEPDKARRNFVNALQLDPIQIDAQLGLIALDAAQEKTTSALDTLAALLEKHPKSIDGWSLQADLLLALDRPKQAMASLNALLEIDGRHLPSLARKAAMMIDQGQYEQARELIGQVRNVDQAGIVSTYLNALLAAHDQRPQEARSGALAILKSFPDHQPALALAAQTESTLGDHGAAETHAMRLLGLAPENASAHQMLASIQLRAGRADRAYESARKAISQGLNTAPVHLLAGESALQMGDNRRARDHFARARAIDPEDSAGRIGTGLAYLGGGQRAQGLEELESAARLNASGHQADMHLILARIDAAEFDKALKAVKQLRSKAGDTALVANLEAVVHMAANKTDAARRALEHALTLDPDYYPAVANQARLDTRAKDTQAARSRFDVYLARHPAHLQASLELSRIEQAAGEPTENILKRLDGLRAAHPQSLEPLLSLSDLLIERGHAADALAQLQGVDARWRGEPALIDRLAHAHARVGNRGQALLEIGRLGRESQLDAAHTNRIADLLMQLGEPARARSMLETALARSPQEASLKIALAGSLISTKELAQARRLIDSLGKASDASALAILRGDLAAAGELWPEAIRHYQSAFDSHHRTYPELIPKLHHALRQADRKQQASTILREALEAHPDHVVLAMYGAEQALEAGDWPAAAALYKRVVARDPRNAIALNNLAWALGQADQPGALAFARQAIAIAPGAPPVLDTYGVLLSRAGSHEQALQALRHAVDAAPETIEYRLHLAEALAASGDISAARKEVDGLLKRQPSGRIADAARGLATRL